MPTARDFCASRMIASSTACGETIIRSASSSITTSRYGSGSSPARPERAVRLGQVARADDRQALVAALHLGDDVRGAPRTPPSGSRRPASAGAGSTRRSSSSIRFGSIRIIRTSSGVARSRIDVRSVLMQPDLPEPVVPAIRRCGIRARSVQTALPEMSLPSQTESGLAEPRQVVEDVAERHHARREVRDLDADRLLARDRREDADLGRRERIREVVLEAGDLRDLRAGRELELVADDARAGDRADDRRVDAEVRERLDEHTARSARSRRRRRRGPAGWPSAASGREADMQRSAARRSRAPVLPRRRRPPRTRREQRRRLGRDRPLRDDVRVRLHPVHRRCAFSGFTAWSRGVAVRVATRTSPSTRVPRGTACAARARLPHAPGPSAGAARRPTLR